MTASPRPSLSPRQLEVLRAVAGGATYRQIARDLGVDEVTVRGYGHRILRALDARSIAHAVHLAQRLLSEREGCGTPEAYHRHAWRGEPACYPCLDRRASDARQARAARARRQKAATAAQEAA